MSREIRLIEIAELCIRVRNGIEELKDKTTLLKGFPHGSCRDTSLLLAMVLDGFGFKDAIYCSKDFDDEMPSHAWLEYDGYLLDLTADQFGSKFPAVIISDGTHRTAIHRKDRMQQPGWHIAGMDSPALINDYKKILDKITRYDVKFYLENHLPSMTDLLEGQKISWSSVNSNFRAYVEQIKNELHTTGATETMREATFFTILYRKQHNLGGTDAMYDFYNTLFLSLRNILTQQEKKPLHRMISRVLLSLDKSYLNFIGELATLNHFMSTGKYSLVNIEEKIHPQSNISADIFLRQKSDGMEILIEVINLHLEAIEFRNEEHLQKHLSSKLTEKADAKRINPERHMFIQPVLWTKDEGQIRLLRDFYVMRKFKIPFVEKPLCYASYRNDGIFEHRFDYINYILD